MNEEMMMVIVDKARKKVNNWLETAKECVKDYHGVRFCMNQADAIWSFVTTDCTPTYEAYTELSKEWREVYKPQFEALVDEAD